MSVFQRITRHLPDFDSAKISTQLEELTGISVAPETLASFLEFASTSTRTNYQTQYSKDAEGNNMRQDAIRFDIFGDGPIKMQDPIVKQITGFVGRPPKNSLQREMSRLQLDPFKLYKPYSEKNQALEIFTQQKLQGNLAASAEAYMKTTKYTSSTNEVDKQVRLKKYLDNQINLAKQDATDTLKRMGAMSEFKGDYESYVRGEIKAMGREDIKKAELGWARVSGKYGYEGMSFNEALESVDNNSDNTLEEREVYKTNMRNLYLGLVKDYGKYIDYLTK